MSWSKECQTEWYYEQQLVNVFSKHFYDIFLSFTGIIKDVKLKKWQPNKKEISMW